MEFTIESLLQSELAAGIVVAFIGLMVPVVSVWFDNRKRRREVVASLLSVIKSIGEYHKLYYLNTYRYFVMKAVIRIGREFVEDKKEGMNTKPFEEYLREIKDDATLNNEKAIHYYELVIEHEAKLYGLLPELISLYSRQKYEKIRDVELKPLFVALSTIFPEEKFNMASAEELREINKNIHDTLRKEITDVGDTFESVYLETIAAFYPKGWIRRIINWF